MPERWRSAWFFHYMNYSSIEMPSSAFLCHATLRAWKWFHGDFHDEGSCERDQVHFFEETRGSGLKHPFLITTPSSYDN